MGTLTSPSGGTSAAVPVTGAGVGAGHGLVVSLLLSSTSVSAALSASDTAGNVYTVARDVNDGGSGDRTVVLVALNTKPVPAGGRITLNFAASAEVHLSVDEFAGVTGIDASAGASATGSSFSSGTATTTQASEVLFGAVGIESGSSPAWSAGWSPLPVLAVGSDLLGGAYQIANAPGGYAASGTSGGTWMAAVVGLKAGPAPPSAPVALAAAAANAQVGLSWQPPASNGGAPVTGYNLYRSTTSGAEVLIASALATASYTDTGLTNGTTYFYKVAALNSVGVGARSGEASATPATVPGPPLGPTATPGNAQVALAWQAPSSNGGAAVTSYNVYRSTTPGSEVLLVAGVTQLSYTDSGLTNGTTYDYEIAAVNSAGAGPLSAEVAGTPRPVPPSAPLGLAAAPGNTQVGLSWQPPASTGGDALTGYDVLRSTTSGAEVVVASGLATTTYTDTGLTNGTAYFYKVRAANHAGSGALSNEASATPAAPPSAPLAPAATAANAQVALSWQAPASNGGAPVSSYSIYRSTTAGAEVLLASNVTLTSYTDTGLTNGVAYYYKVAAVNSAGVGAQSAEVSATPHPVAPSAPIGLGAAPGDAQVFLTWQAPASNGGAALTGYSVYRSTTSGAESLLASGISGTTYTDTGLANGTAYFYKVLATNSAGSGPLSNEAAATPRVPPASAVAVYAGYYDDHHPGRPQPRPSPWLGSPGVVFVGANDSGQVGGSGWDTSTVRVDNLSGAPLAVTVTVDIGGQSFALWGSNTIPAGGTLVVAQTGYGNFDGSDTNSAGCYGCGPQTCANVSSTIPVVHVTFAGKTTDYYDNGQVLNTFGVDSAGCPYDGNRNDESVAWRRL